MRTRRLPVLLLLGALSGSCGAVQPVDLVAPEQPFDPARVRIVVPEVYELANIIVAMTSYGQSSPSLVFKTGDYYRQVNTAFGPFRNHHSMKSLQLDSEDPLRRYYELRDNSFIYVFDADLLKRNPDYFTLWNPNTFAGRLAAVQQFSNASGFRAFYAAHAGFYQEFIERYRALADLDAIADWLEQEFAPTRFDHYTVALSPLVYGSHSTHHVVTSHGSEAIMFVSGPDVTSGPGTSAGVRRAIVQRIVFTEIDHQFVNPVTAQFGVQVNAAFGTRSKWTTDASTFYSSPGAVFNEYMTWAVFLLYAEPRLSPEDFSEVVRLTTELMQGARRFQQFGAFAAELLRLYHERAPQTRVSALYPAILEWASRQ